jgi:hypothetical protein
MQMVLQGTGDSNSILQSGSSSTQTLYCGVTNLNRLLTSLCNNLPGGFNVTTPDQCYDTIKMNFLAAGSLVTVVGVNGGPYTTDSQASTALNNAYGSGKALDGVNVYSVSTTVQGYTPGGNSNTSSPNNGPNLGLILGLSIPLTVLLVLIIVVLALRNKEEKDTADIAEREDGAVDSVDQVDKIEKI